MVAQIVIPIQDGELKGLLYVFNRTARPFSDRDEAALSRLANHAAVAIGNAHLLREMESRRREAEILAEVGRLISRSLEPDEVGQRIVDSIGPLLGSAMATLYRISLETGDFVLLASAGVGVDWNSTLPRGTAAVGLAVREGRPPRPPTCWPIRGSPRAETYAALESFEHRAILALLLIAGDRAFGASRCSDARVEPTRTRSARPGRRPGRDRARQRAASLRQLAGSSRRSSRESGGW